MGENQHGLILKVQNESSSSRKNTALTLYMKYQNNPQEHLNINNNIFLLYSVGRKHVHYTQSSTLHKDVLLGTALFKLCC